VPFFCAFRSAFGGSIGIRLVLLGLVVLPTTELVLPFNVDCHSPIRETPRIGERRTVSFFATREQRLWF